MVQKTFLSFSLPIFLFLLVFLILPFLETFGIYSHTISLFFVCMIPIFFYLPVLLSQKKMVYPQKVTIFFVGFLLTSLFSVIVSGNVQQTFEYMLLYIAAFLLFIYFYNVSDAVAEQLPTILFILSGFYIAYAFFLKFIAVKYFPFLIPLDGYQIIFDTFIGHNHLGDFLAIMLLLSLYLLTHTQKKLYFIYIVFVFPLYIYSFSRSAYTALIFTLCFWGYCFLREKKYQLYSKYTAVFLVVIGISMVYFFTTVVESQQFPLLNTIRSITIPDTGHNKYFLSKRFEYISEAFTAIKNTPLSGVGPGNFFSASKKYTQVPFSISTTSHNIFLDIAAENGIPAVLFFIAFVALIFWNGKKNGYYFLAFLMLINFQTDYTHRIYSQFLLFFIFLGLCYKEPILRKTNMFSYIAIGIFLIVNCMLLSEFFFSHGKYFASVFSYPLQKKAYEAIITEGFTHNKMAEVHPYLYVYKRLFYTDTDGLLFIANTYDAMKYYKSALSFKVLAFQSDKFSSFSLVRDIYERKRRQEGQKSASVFLDKFFADVLYSQNTFLFPRSEQVTMLSFCETTKTYTCPKGVWMAFF